MREIMLQRFDVEYLNQLLTAMSSEVRAFLVTLLRSEEYQGDLDLERLTSAAEITGNGFTKENFRFNLQNALEPFLDTKVLLPDGKHTQKRKGYRLNREGYDDLVPVVDAGYDITHKLMTDSLMKHSIPYLLSKTKNPLVLVLLADYFGADDSALESSVVESFKQHGIARPTLYSFLGTLEEAGLLFRCKEVSQVDYRECSRHEQHTKKIKRTMLKLTESGAEVFRYFRDMKLFLRASQPFFPREHRKEVLRGNHPIGQGTRILYVGTRHDWIKPMFRELDWDIDIYKLLPRVDTTSIEEFETFSAKMLGKYKVVILDGYCENGNAQQMASVYCELKADQASNGTSAVFLTYNHCLADRIERGLPINYIFLTDPRGNILPDKLQEVIYKLAISSKSVKKWQFDCSF